ncbi:PilZ domain-containing protein [Iodidimonas sp. MBR-14]|uniref:PilZ domain-containing protein n=1 Tax=Iodidimonas sp. MBR-14 TaxID=3032319 RepID=UPI002482DF86|nr:PilZ domain-containing protein [Iodidimonas sp. MBR-14]
MSNDHDDRRHDLRMNVSWPAKIITQNDQIWPCDILDVSWAGTHIASPAPLVLGEELILDIPNLGEFAARVQWQHEKRYGLTLLLGPDLLLRHYAEHIGPDAINGAKNAIDDPPDPKGKI